MMFSNEPSVSDLGESQCCASVLRYLCFTSSGELHMLLKLFSAAFKRNKCATTVPHPITGNTFPSNA